MLGREGGREGRREGPSVSGQFQGLPETFDLLRSFLLGWNGMFYSLLAYLAS